MELGTKEIGIGIGVVLLLGLVVAGVLYSGGDKAPSKATARDEVPALMKEIAKLEIAQAEPFSRYESASAAPRDAHEVNASAVPWVPKRSRGFDRIGFVPSNTLFGSYEVTASANGFVVKGTCDTDGDGNAARFELKCESSPDEALKCSSIEPVMLTDAAVF